MPRTCAFCGGRPVTAEDAWPLWIGRNIPEGLWTLKGPDGVEVKSSQIKHRIKCACGPCNNRWMSDLEQRARDPLLKVINRTVGPLTVADQRVIGEWALKTIMVWEYAKGVPPYFTPEERAAVRGGRWDEVADVSIGLGDFSGVLVGALALPRDLPLVTDQRSGETVPAFVGTLVVRHSFIAVIADRYSQRTDRDCVYAYPTHADRLAFVGDQGKLPWPPERSFGDLELRQWLAYLGSRLLE